MFYTFSVIIFIANKSKLIKNIIPESLKKNRFLQILFLLVFVIMIFNVFNYFHELGYDGQHHKYNIEVLPFNIPTSEDTKEFFNPPMPYLLPSVVDKICDRYLYSELRPISCTRIYGNVAQIFQMFLFFGILYFLLRISDIIEPGNKNYKNILFLFFLLPAVNFKTFAMIRGEPYVSFFVIATIYHYLYIYKRKSLNNKDLIINVLLLGSIGLSKQWGLLFFPALGISSLVLYFYHEKLFFIKYLLFTIKSFLLSFFIFGWFYYHLYAQYGSITAFNREPSTFSFSNQPTSFYFDFALSDLFSNPIRGFDMVNKLFPILHSETYGDYWGYFLVTLGKGGVNNYEIVPYLGRVNFLALIPTCLFIFGIIFTVINLKKQNEINQIFYILIFLTILFSWLGYMWFLIKYPNLDQGDTIKATYIILIINLLPFFSANLMEKIRLWNKKIYSSIYFILIIIFLHNLPTFYTRYSGIFT